MALSGADRGAGNNNSSLTSWSMSPTSNDLIVVSGFMRSGTSMMMRALQFGGIEVAYNPERDRNFQAYSDASYHPNKHGFYELEQSELDRADFYEKYSGHAVKLIISKMESAQYRKAIFMLRDPKEIIESLQAFFIKLPNGNFTQVIQEAQQKMFDITQDVPDKCILVNYRKVIEKPLEQMQRIANFGISIDPEKAAQAVDPACCRFLAERML